MTLVGREGVEPPQLSRRFYRNPHEVRRPPRTSAMNTDFGPRLRDHSRSAAQVRRRCRQRCRQTLGRPSLGRLALEPIDKILTS